MIISVTLRKPSTVNISGMLIVFFKFVMQNIEEWALATYKRTLPLWLCYINNTFTAVHKDEIDDFHKHLNGQNADIQFTKEIEENGKIPFLDCLVTHNNNELRTTIYRKPTHTDRLLNQSSYNPTSHKATTIRTLTRHALLVCDSPDSLTDEIKYLDNVFNKSNITTQTLLDTTLTETPNRMLRTLMWHLLLLQPYLTSKGLLKLSQESYNPTTSALLTNLSLLNDSYWRTLKTNT